MKRGGHDEGDDIEGDDIMQHKLLIAASGSADANLIATVLESMPAPEPLAVSMFRAEEDGGGTNKHPDDADNDWPSGDADPSGSSQRPDLRNGEADKPGGWTVEAYYAAPPDIDAIRAAVAEGLQRDASAASLDPSALKISCAHVPDENWVALSQSALPPVLAGRFTIYGSHDRATQGYKQSAIEIDAGEAFGTAHHDTTLGCLLAIDKLAHSLAFNTVLDLGCGSAVLAIAAARAIPEAHILASDIDPQATQVARANVKNNGETRRIKVITATGFAHPTLMRPGQFDLIIANILAGPLILLARDMARALESGGVAILSGILTEQAAEVIAAYRAAGFQVAEHKRLTEWSTLVLQRR